MYDKFAATLRELMDVTDTNGAELGRRLDGTDKSLVSRWRRGLDRPAAETVARIATIFGVDQIAMLQLAEWLPGEPKDIDPRRANLMMIVRDELPEEDLPTVERMLQGLRSDHAVPPIHGGKRRIAPGDNSPIQSQPESGATARARRNRRDTVAIPTSNAGLRGIGHTLYRWGNVGGLLSLLTEYRDFRPATAA